MFNLFKSKAPQGVPEAAIFNRDQKEWELFNKNEEGAYEREYRSWREDGTLACVCFYKEGELHGEWKRYHPNGEVARERQFEEGEEVGVEKWHRSSVATPENSNLQDDHPFPYKVWTVGMDHETDETFFWDREGNELHPPDGDENSQEEEDEEEETAAYIPVPKTASLPVGVPAEAQWMEEDGEWEMGTYDDQKRKQGEFKWWRTDGTLSCVSIFTDDQLNGKFKRYHPDGSVAQEGEFKMNQPIGKQIWYRSNQPSPEGMEFSQFPKGVCTIIMDHDPSSKKPFDYLDKNGKSYSS